MKNGFWHFIWRPCMGSKWAGLLMKLFTGPATQPRWSCVNTHTRTHTYFLSLLCCVTQVKVGISPSDSSLVWAQNIPQTDILPFFFFFLLMLALPELINRISGLCQAYTYIYILQWCVVNVKWLLGINTACVLSLIVFFCVISALEAVCSLTDGARRRWQYRGFHCHFSWIRRMAAAIIVMLFTFGECLLHFEHSDHRYHPARQTDIKKLYSRSAGFYMCGVVDRSHGCMRSKQWWVAFERRRQVQRSLPLLQHLSVLFVASPHPDGVFTHIPFHQSLQKAETQ